MKNLTNNVVTNTILACAASASAPVTAAFGTVAAAVVAAQPAQRDRAFAGMWKRGIAAPYPGSPPWSIPI